MKLVFMGTPDYAVNTLEALIAAGHNVAAVFAQPDKPVGRKHIITAPPIKVCAEKHGINVYQPNTLRDGKAEEILKLVREEDSDFEKLIMEYSEDERSVYSFGKGEMESSFEEASFNLETGQISDIVETSYGYHIIKCISTFNREETDANKVKIVEKRKEEVFGQEYEAFVTTLTRNINEELWESVSLIHDENVTTMDFFEIYNKYFEKDS